VFRSLRFPELARPPHGWKEIFWEIAIVTVGVFIALAAQQWAEDRDWESKAQAATEAFKGEVSDHYAWAVEWRMVEPCVVAQIDRLQQRVEASPDQLLPAPLYSEAVAPSYVIRIPNKEYHSAVWQATISDGVSPHLDPRLRDELNSHYTQAELLNQLTNRNQSDQDRMLVLSRPLDLDPTVRFSLVQTLSEMRGRAKFMGLVSGQLINHVLKENMRPSDVVTWGKVARYGTYKFCRANRFPTRPFNDALKPLPN
jgi:hypothetical protein